ncbi:hypothetical protein [Brevundimonas sp. Root1279]|uniref:hypothetical protein n=1 Tax=Brevundimonas sp. Root1279 TaxID=1736443 RepID=UPI00070098A5|nr:hypothetical protein [Brevundimonas sp. Root1279]KQW81940.1 hypothetical protein ASC65_11705 [Brevundimonas sp. Root1279]
MKPLLLAAVLLAIPVVANAQVAAGSVPNTFDRPATQPARPAAAPAARAPARPAAGETEALSPNRVSVNSEGALRAFIRGAQAGQIDYAVMSDDLAGQVRQQESSVTPIVQGFGAIEEVRFMGSRGTADQYAVTFANGATEWMIGFNEDGKIAALLFRPAQ